MLETAELVAERYAVSRARQDELALVSQTRAAAAQEAGRFDAEIVPITVCQMAADRATGEVSRVERIVTADEGVRPDTTAEGLSGLRPVLADDRFADPSVTAGNASQLSDGAAARVVTETGVARALGLTPLGYYRGLAVTGCDPEEMGVGPIAAVTRLLEHNDLAVDDIGLWELNEAFASQAVHCRDVLGIDPERMNRQRRGHRSSSVSLLCLVVM